MQFCSPPAGLQELPQVHQSSWGCRACSAWAMHLCPKTRRGLWLCCGPLPRAMLWLEVAVPSPKARLHHTCQTKHLCCSSWVQHAGNPRQWPGLTEWSRLPCRSSNCKALLPLPVSHRGISPLSLLHRTPSSTQCVAAVHGEAAGCGCHRFSLHPGPISGAQLCPHCTAVWICPQSSSMQSAGSSWQQSFLLSDPSTVLLPVLSPCCSTFVDLDVLKRNFSWCLTLGKVIR